MALNAIRDYIIGLVLFSIVIVGGIFVASGFAAQDQTMLSDPMYSSFQKSFDKSEDLTTQVNLFQSNLQGNEDLKPGLFGFLDSLIGISWNSLTLLFSSFSFVGEILSGLTAIFGVPVWLMGLLGLIITMVIAFAILSAVFKVDL